MRIGDGDRDAAAASLGDHYAAGRLTKEEYDERAELVWQAKVRADLAPLFADLPGADGTRAPTRQAVRAPAYTARSSRAPQFSPIFALLAVVVLVGLTIVLTPWLLFGLFFLGMCGAGHRRSRMTHRWQGS